MSGALLQHLWQSTWFGLGAALVVLALRNNAARVRYWIWFAASVKFLIPFSLLTRLGALLQWRAGILPEPGSFISTVREVAAPLAAAQVPLHTSVSATPYLGPVLLAIWGVGCMALLIRWVLRWERVNAAAREATPTRIEAPIPVRSTPVLCEPGVVGILHPVLLLPTGITERLTPQQLQAILAHELCHVRRNDNLTATIHMALEVTFWFHPLIWWIGARLLEERERACDEAVLELGNDSETYAEGILKVCQLYVESRLACVAGVSGADLKKRIEAIMKNPMTPKLGPAKKVMVGAAATAALVLPIAVGLTSAPRAVGQATQVSSVATGAFDSVNIVKTAQTNNGM